MKAFLSWLDTVSWAFPSPRNMVVQAAMKRYDMDVVPYEITPAMIKDAILELEEYNKKMAA